MVSSNFPNELVDVIISCVSESGWLTSEDKRTLRSCALVHRDWLPASRHALLSCVELITTAAWDSFLSGVINSEEMRPWFASIHRFKFIDPLIHTHYPDGKCIPPGPVSTWRGQYVLPVLAGQLPNLHSLTLTVDWAQCPPHPITFGSFSQLTSLRQLVLNSCGFPSFCTFRRVLVLLPLLKDLICYDVHWLSAPQPSILALPSSRPALHSLSISFFCRTCTLALLEWLTHTPTPSTLVDIDLLPSWYTNRWPQEHRITFPNTDLDYYLQIFAPAVRKASLCLSASEDISCRITLSRFASLNILRLEIRRDEWTSIADMLRSLPGRLNTLHFQVSHESRTRNDDRLVEEDGELKAMKINGLELLDPVLSRDNVKDLSWLDFCIAGYRDALSPLRERTLEFIQQKLPTLHKCKTLDIQLWFQYSDRESPFSKCSHSVE